MTEKVLNLDRLTILSQSLFTVACLICLTTSQDDEDDFYIGHSHRPTVNKKKNKKKKMKDLKTEMISLTANVLMYHLDNL